MPVVFGFHTFCDLISGPILALSHKSLNTYYNHGVAKCHIPRLHINLKQLHFHR